MQYESINSKTKVFQVSRMQKFMKTRFSEIYINLSRAICHISEPHDAITLNIYNCGYYTNMIKAKHYYAYLAERYLNKIRYIYRNDMVIKDYEDFMSIRELALCDEMFKIICDISLKIGLAVKWFFDEQERNRLRVDILYRELAPHMSIVYDVVEEIIKYWNYVGILHKDDTHLVQEFKQTKKFQNEMKKINKEIYSYINKEEEVISKYVQDLVTELQKEFGDAVKTVDATLNTASLTTT